MDYKAPSFYIERGKAATLQDESGNPIGSHLSVDGDYHLATAMQQAITTSTNNSTAANLASLATFTGTSDEVLGACAIQVFHASDKECTIYIDQGVDSSFADLTQTVTDSFTCLANEPCTRTFYSVAPYYRMRVTNNSADTTTKLATYTGMTPVINPLPRKLSTKGNLQVVSSLRGDENYDRHVWVNPTNELAVSPVYRLVGTTFIGDTIDPNFWTAAVANDGTVTEGGGYVELKTSAKANGSASITSVRKGRFVAGSAMLMSGAVNWVTAGTANNVRRVGVYTSTDGYFFQLSGTTFSVGTRTGSADTLVSSGSFNGNLGTTFVPTADTYYKIAIEWAPIGVLFYINGALLHKIGGAILSATPTLPIMIDNDNGAITTDISFKCLGMYIARQGELITNPTYYHVSGNAVAEKVLKYGAGVLQKVVYNNVSGTSLTLYDGISVATGGIIGIITTTANAIGVWNYNVPFSTGLTIATVGNGLDATIVYE